MDARDLAMGAERVSSNPASATDHVRSELPVGYDAKATRRLLRRVDFALIPFLALLYL